MMYAKIDEKGNVIEFPYRFDDSTGIPTDAVEVDTNQLKPAIKWDQKLLYDNIQKTPENKYLLSYTISDKFETFAQKQEIIKIIKTQYLRQNLKMFEEKIRELKSGYSADEILSWDIQVDEANKFFNGDDIKNALIDNISKIRGMPIQELATRILQKRDIFLQKYGEILGQFQKNADILDSIQLDDPTTYDCIDNYGWDK